MKYVNRMIFAVLLISINANAQSNKDTYEKLASQFTEASDVRKYLQKVWRCPKGICLNGNIAKDLKRFRASAISQCKISYKNDPIKGERCRKIIETTPKVFSSHYTETAVQRAIPASSPDAPDPQVEPRKVADADISSEKREEVCKKDTIFICPDGQTQVKNPKECLPFPLAQQIALVCALDGREVSDKADCVTGMGKLWRIILILMAVFLLITFAASISKGKKLKDTLASNEELRKSNEDLAKRAEENEAILRENFSREIRERIGKLPTISASIVLDADKPAESKTPTGQPSPNEKPAVLTTVPKSEGGTMLGIVDPNATLPPLPPSPIAEPVPQNPQAGTPIAPAEGDLPFLKSPHDNTILGQPAMKPPETPDDKSGGKK